MAWADPGPILVAGSLHLDVIVNAPALPRLDETLMGQDVTYAFGGKGGNQALAAARMGGAVALAGRVGTDGFGDQILRTLRDADIDYTQVHRDPGASGMSVAIVDQNGDYGAVVVSAANQHVQAEEITLPKGTALLLLQNELPAAVNRALAVRAQAQGTRVIWNAAPARHDPELLANTDLLIVNRVEAADMTGLETPQDQAVALARSCPVVVTLGGDGLTYAGPDPVHLPAQAVTPISTHGAGDAFTGALAAQLAGGQEIPDALVFAQTAAALHVSLPVAQRGTVTPDRVRAVMMGG
ncbi:MAG: ribokinase [Paracoccaceae bacterium]